jgi:hypothetical protein
MSKLTEEHRRLHAFAGEWAGEEMIYPAPPDRGGRASARVSARAILDGFFVATSYTEEREGAPPYHGHGVFGWDPVGRAYTMHWFDSMGSFPSTVARGQWAAGRGGPSSRRAAPSPHDGPPSQRTPPSGAAPSRRTSQSDAPASQRVPPPAPDGGPEHPRSLPEEGADAELVFEQRTHQGYARYIYRFPATDVYVFRIESSKEGRDWRPFMEGKYRRIV